ncbi:MAG: glycoside hydrolase family 97 N-terminal domain-containing protein, partial [Tannerellaceae bacterium]
MKEVLFALSIMGAVSCTSATQQHITSPDKQLNLSFETSQDGFLSYTLINGTDTVLAPSRLGFVLQDGDSICRDLQIEDVAFSSFDEVWHRQWGENKSVRNQYNQALVSVMHKPTSRLYRVNFRLFDDGVALRYEFPDAFANDSIVIMDEVTEFKVNGNPETWWSYADFNTYEKLFMNNRLDSVSWAATPMSMRKDNGTHLFIHEAAIVKYPDMTIKNM